MQEKINKVALKFAKKNSYLYETSNYGSMYFGFINGAGWQSEKMYSEEDMLNFAWFLLKNIGQYSCDKTAHFEGKYFEQYKTNKI